MAVLTLIQGEGGVVGHRFPIILFLMGNDLPAGEFIFVAFVAINTIRFRMTCIAFFDLLPRGFQWMNDPEPRGVGVWNRVHPHCSFPQVHSQFSAFVTIHAEGNAVTSGTLRTGGLGINPVLPHPQRGVSLGGAQHSFLDLIGLVALETQRPFGNNAQGARYVATYTLGDLILFVDDV